MKPAARILLRAGAVAGIATILSACAFDITLRAYLDAHFWLPFSKETWNFERPRVRRISKAYAGMVKAQGHSPLDDLRADYQGIPVPEPYATGAPPPFDYSMARLAVAAARADRSLTARDREEIDLIDAKIDMREGQVAKPEPLRRAKSKLEQFLKTAHTPEFLSEARGWIAHIDHVLGDQTAAGKIYLDELNRNGSNLSRETLLTSLRINYGYDGGPQLLQHLDEYFDTPEHAAFAIQMVTNPHWPDYFDHSYNRGHYGQTTSPPPPDNTAQVYARVQSLLQQHRELLQSETGANALALLSMRVALRMGDPPGALKIADMIPAAAKIRAEPDFQWMLASAQVLSRDYAAAEKPLLDLFVNPASSADQQAAAAYGLCGVYFKLGNPVEQIRYALWLRQQRSDVADPTGGIADKSIYWAMSGWDLNLLLDYQAPISALEDFLAKYPKMPRARSVKYALAVRLARESRYAESAQIYQDIGAPGRAARMRTLAALYAESTRTDLPQPQQLEAKYKLAQFLAAHPEEIYFNADLWFGLQRYALFGDTDDRFTRAERDSVTAGERKLKDDQEERWRAYLILRDVVDQAGTTKLGRDAAQLALRCLRHINTDRFGREDDIRNANIQLSQWLQRR